jgi:four helix bundle protein
MLVGLRQSWGQNALRDDTQPYESCESGYFGHERLDAYRIGLEFISWFHGLPAGAELSSRLFRQVDKAATSAVLNIAEGNGRFPPDDRRRFLEIAEGSCVKTSAYLDLCESKAELSSEQRQQGVDCLARMALMIRGLANRRQEDEL